VAADPEHPRNSTNASGAPAAVRRIGGRFELLQEIGSGSSGTVYRARLLAPYGDLAAGDEVAVKFLRPELAADERARARLFAEGELGQSLDHPNVAAIHGVETLPMLGLETTYLVMQYVAGTTLRDFLDRSGAPVEDLTRRLGADAAKGLYALHRRGLVHRDIKPENLILTPDSTLKIVDLGLVRPFGAGGSGSGSGSAARSGSARSSGFGLAGSVAYAAPESLRGEAAGPRADLYSLGLVLYELTTGKHPFAHARTPDEMLDAHLFTAPQPPSHLRPRVSPFLETLLLDLLQKNPDDRPRSAADLARFLEQGEHSDYWRRHEERAPALASSRRLLRLRRPAEAPFAGRRDELDHLDEALAAARRGKGRVIAITGPLGIGRRRLLDEAIARWLERSEPPVLLGGEADSGHGHAEPFASSVLDVLLRGDASDSPNAEQRAIDRARTLLGCPEATAMAIVQAATGRSSERPEVRADRLATALLGLVPRQQVLVIRVDHADELDTSGRLVLQRLAAAAHDRPLLVLLANGPDAQLPEGVERLDLAGLSLDAFLEFGRALFRDGEADERFLTAAHQLLSGLPGNLLETLDHLAGEGAVRGRPGDYHGLDPAAELRPAPGHVERFRSRVASLEPRHRSVLAAAAVLGDRCALDDLAALVGKSPLAVLETLSLFRGRIVRAQGGEVSFRHRDFRRALLHALPNDEQQRLHKEAAAHFAARNAEPLVVGMHLSQAFEHEACLEPLLQALEERVRAGSRRTALRLCGRLAVHFRHVPESDAVEALRLRFLLAGGRAHANARQREQASRHFQNAERLARTRGDVDASAAARTGFAECELDEGRVFAAITLLEGVHDDLADRTDAAANGLAAAAHGLHGRILLYLGQAQDGLKHQQAALKRLPADATTLRFHLLIDLARLEALSHRYATALRTLQDVERSADVAQLPRVRVRCTLYGGQVLAVLGDDQAGQELRRALADAESLGLFAYAGRAALLLAERQFRRGRDDEAIARCREALAFAHTGDDRFGAAMARCYLVRLGAEPLGDLAGVVDALDLPALRANLALALAGRGEATPATDAVLEQVLDTADLTLSLHLRALTHLGRPAMARSLVRSIAERIPQRPMRQRFLTQWNRGIRV
jgi:tetratricopeptide (TPR) repeat protein